MHAAESDGGASLLLPDESATARLAEDIAAVLRDQQAPAGRQIADSNTTFAVIYAPQQQRMWLSCGGAPASHGLLRAYDAQGRRLSGADIV